MLTFAGTAFSLETDKDFAKCQKMLSKHAASLVERAAKAKTKHDRKTKDRISKYAAGQPDPLDEKTRMRAIIERLAARFELPEYQRILIDEAAEEVLTVENNEKFKCPKKANVNRGFKRNFDRFAGRIEEIDDAVEERLDLEDIGPNEGLVVVLFYASGYAENVLINRLGGIGGNISFGPIQDREYFRVLKVKAGDYRWHSIWNSHWLGGRTVLFVKHSNLDFTVEAGKLNYTGVFMFSNKVWRRWRADLRDRTSVVLSLLEDQYPELIDTMEIANGVDDDDRFIQFYRSERASLKANNDGA